MPVLDQGKWGGICGFVSVLHALNVRNGGLANEQNLDQMGSKEIHQRLGAEMITYLRQREVEAPKIIEQIVDFSQSFGGQFSNYSIQDVIQKIKQGVISNFNTQNDFESASGLCGGVGMPLDAVIDYLQYVGLRSTMIVANGSLSFTQAEFKKHKDCILGIGDKRNINTQYRGLRHWVYVDDQGMLWNWGSKTSLDGGVAKPYNHPLHNYVLHVLKIK
ncbi:hypothetical protein ACFL2V_16905 [Pseudomonadota bacterium]